MRTWTARQCSAASDWLRRRWNSPDRTDHYLMQIAQEIVRSRVKPEAINSVTLGSFEITFEQRTQSERERDQREADLVARKLAKERTIAWASRGGKVKIEHRRVPRE